MTIFEQMVSPSVASRRIPGTKKIIAPKVYWVSFSSELPTLLFSKFFLLKFLNGSSVA